MLLTSSVAMACKPDFHNTQIQIPKKNDSQPIDDLTNNEINNEINNNEKVNTIFKNANKEVMTR